MVHHFTDLITRQASDKQLAWLFRKTPPAFFQSLARHRFVQTVRCVAVRSPFYQRRFAEHGIEARRVRTPSDLGDFFTTPEDVVEHSEEMLCRPPSIVFESSGTSGKNKRVYYGRDELDQFGQTVATGLRLMGLRHDDRVANGFDFSIWIPGLLTHYGLVTGGWFSQACSKVDPIEVYRRLEQYRFTVVLGEPTWLIRLTELAEKHGRRPLRMLIGGAEEMPRDAIPWMERVWADGEKLAKIKMGYGTVEMGGSLGFQPCDNHDGYHLDTVDFLTEIVEPDADGFGEIAFSTLNRRTMPLLRYRTRDITRFSRTACSCGLGGPHIERLRGRVDDLVIASGGNLYPLMFEKILAAVPGIGRDWQVLFKLEGVREVVEIHLETERHDIATLEAQLHAQAADQYPDFIKNLSLGIFKLAIKPYGIGTLREGRKLRRLIDLRYDQPPSPMPIVFDALPMPTA